MATPQPLRISLVDSAWEEPPARARGNSRREITSSMRRNTTSQAAALEPEEEEDDKIETQRSRKMFFGVKVLFGIILFILVLVCLVFSKLTFVSLIDSLRNVTAEIRPEMKEPLSSTFTNLSVDLELKVEENEHKIENLNVTNAIALYWQLLLLITIPSLISFLRALFFGVLGKTTKSYPWPTRAAVITGVIGTILEVAAVSVLVFLVLPEMPPGMSILLLSGVFFGQIVVDFFLTGKTCCCYKAPQEYLEIDGRQDAVVKLNRINLLIKFVNALSENRFTKLLALFTQILGIAGFYCLWVTFSNKNGLELEYRSLVGLPLCLLTLSVIWSNKFQDFVAKITPDSPSDGRTARYKSTFLNSALRLVLYPFITFLVFAYLTPHRVHPWCFTEDPCPGFPSVEYFTGHEGHNTLAVFLVQVLTSLFAYFFAWIACTMTLGPYGMALPLLISTPLAALVYYMHQMLELDALFFPDFSESNGHFVESYPYAPLVVLLLWIGQFICIGCYVLTKTNIILSNDSDMFITPHYDGVFVEQHMILNRQIKKHTSRETQTNRGTYVGNTLQRTPRMIFICSTMYRENATEMRQMLKSIKRIAKHCEREKILHGNETDTYESHIFFDGALNGTQLQKFGLQLLSLLKDAIGVEPEKCFKVKTPYGMSLQFHINMVKPMPFVIHFKDRNLVKPKKRWSQVMYMNYVINHRIEQDDNLSADNTFILTTDADIDFSAKSAAVLLDMLETNSAVGSVCARTHPKGSGPLYWYQVFDYAIGHWFQKPAEHMLGSVLCSPGCFSLYRCSALQEVLETYSSLAENAMEFLMKDMGEDRWLCTLLIKKGWKLEYCAISEDQTFVPMEFDEFFGQRRRWIPSTVANLSLLISEAVNITKRNDAISILFVLYQAVLVFSTAISPATVILILGLGLQSAFGIPSDWTIVIISLIVLISVLYGAICLFASPKSQLDAAKILSFIFAIVMIIVIAGIFKDVINSIFPYPKLVLLQAPNCSQFDVNHSAPCLNDARYLNSLPNSMEEQFKLPVSTIVLYLGLFGVTFVGAAILHPYEFTCLFHFLWYLLALPAGYLFLLIYSAANLDSQSWGTREGSSGKDEGLLGWTKYFKKAWKSMVSCCIKSRCCKPDEVPAVVVDRIETGLPPAREFDMPEPAAPTVRVVHDRIDEDAWKWLNNIGCNGDYIMKFEEHGYTSKHYIAAMSLEDFGAIGIDKRGYRLKLNKAAKKLPSLPIPVDIPSSVNDWLTSLEMSEYIQLFRSEGYETGEDIENLKGLTEEELIRMGVVKRAHLQRLNRALHSLAYPKESELKMFHTKALIENLDFRDMDEAEEDFWLDLVEHKLKPLSTRLTSTEEVQLSLKGLRNTVLIVMFLMNIMWIITLYMIEFPRLSDYGLDPKAMQLLFLLVYGLIILVQFCTMLCHRVITLIHYFGRITPTQIIAPPRNIFPEREQNF